MLTVCNAATLVRSQYSEHSSDAAALLPLQHVTQHVRLTASAQTLSENQTRKKEAFQAIQSQGEAHHLRLQRDDLHLLLFRQQFYLRGCQVHDLRQQRCRDAQTAPVSAPLLHAGQ